MAKRVVSPGLEPGTFSVLARNHDQLDHETVLLLDLMEGGVANGIEVDVRARRGHFFWGGMW